MNPVSERYAEAFFSLALDEGKVALLREQVESLLGVFDRQTIKFLDTRSISKQEKKDVLSEVFKDADKDLKNLVCLLVDTGRSHYVNEILEGFVELSNEELGIQEVTVYSARKLTESELEQIRKAVEAKIKKTVEIENRIDETLLAGTRIYINDRVYDSSLKAKVSHLKEELLKESW